MRNLEGKKFGRLTVISYSHKNKKRLSYWLCRCECGKEKIIRGSSLVAGEVRSCGCLHQEKSREVCHSNFSTHGDSKSRLYSIWYKMKQRCFNEKDSAYVRYGGRGITVCDSWANSFVSFRSWSLENGYSDKLSIDRIDNNGNYCPENCRWATCKIQSNNTRRNLMFSYLGKTQTLKSWCDELGKKYKLVWERIQRYHKPFEQAIK